MGVGGVVWCVCVCVCVCVGEGGGEGGAVDEDLTAGSCAPLVILFSSPPPPFFVVRDLLPNELFIPPPLPTNIPPPPLPYTLYPTHPQIADYCLPPPGKEPAIVACNITVQNLRGSQQDKDCVD